jgi:hypothetical protein
LSTSDSLNTALSIFTTCLFTRLCCSGLLVQECEEELTGLSQDKDCLKETCIGAPGLSPLMSSPLPSGSSLSAVRLVFKLTKDMQRKVEKLTLF